MFVQAPYVEGTGLAVDDHNKYKLIIVQCTRTTQAVWPKEKDAAARKTVPHASLVTNNCYLAKAGAKSSGKKVKVSHSWMAAKIFFLFHSSPLSVYYFAYMLRNRSGSKAITYANFKLSSLFN